MDFLSKSVTNAHGVHLVLGVRKLAEDKSRSKVDLALGEWVPYTEYERFGGVTMSSLPRMILRAFMLVLSGALLVLGAALEAFAAVFRSEGKSWLKREGGEQSGSMGMGVTDAGDREPIWYDQDDVPRGAFSGRRIVRRS